MSNVATSLTLSGDEALEVDGDGHPHGLAVVLGPEAPHADIHGLGAWLGREACEEEGLLGEVVRLPALTLVCGEPADSERTEVLTEFDTALSCTVSIPESSLLYGLHLSFMLSLHSHDKTPRVQDAVVVRTPQCPPPVITPVGRNKHIRGL